MNICLISREYPPFFGGGIGTYTVQWSRTLAAAGHRVVVVTVSDDGTERREEEAGVTIVRLPFIRGADWSGPHPAIATPEARAAFTTFSPVSVFAMQIAAAMPRLAEEFALDVIEAPETGALAWFALNDRRTGRLWRAGGPPIVTMIHSPTEWIAYWNRSPLRGRRDLELAAMEEDSLRWSDALVCPTRVLARWVCERYRMPEDRVTVIPHPLGDLEAVAARRAAEETAMASEPGRIAFVGRLEPRKGIDTLLAGFATAVQLGADIRLDLAGEDVADPSGQGRFGESCLARLAPEVRARITVHGRLGPSKVAGVQDSASIVALPAPMDNFPYACVEAMARGRLIVAARAGGMAEMIRDGVDGVLFDPGDADACAAALNRAVAMPPSEVAAMGRSAAARILSLCNNRSVVEQRLAHYERAVAASRRRCSPTARTCCVVNGTGIPDAALERLKEAAAWSGAGFAHGWTRHPGGGVRAFSTPRVELLALAPRRIGPLVVDAAVLEDPAVRRLLRVTGPDRAEADCAWALAMVLLAGGVTGVVAPDVVIEQPDDPHDVAARAAVAELRAIRASRGWRVLERIYDVLHILRGRGLRRR